MFPHVCDVDTSSINTNTCVSCVYIYIIWMGRRGLKKGGGVGGTHTPPPTNLRGIELRIADRPSPLPTHFKHTLTLLAVEDGRVIGGVCASTRVTDTAGKKERDGGTAKKREFWYQRVARRWKGERERSVRHIRGRGVGERGEESVHSLSLMIFYCFWPKHLCACIYMYIRK